MNHSVPSMKKDHTSIYSPIDVFQSPPFNPMPPHYHDSVELMYFSEDIDAPYILDGKEHIIRAGDLIIVNSNHIHACYYQTNTVKIVCVLVSADFLYAINREDVQYQNHISGDARICEVFESLYTGSNTSPGAAFHNLSEISRLFSILTREYTTDARPADPGRLHKLVIVRQAMEYIEKHFDKEISVETLAKLSGFSVSRFSHIFREILDLAPMMYICQVRISKACELLVKTKLSITEISDKCGFNSSAYFTKIFRRQLGSTPGVYRKQALQSRYSS